MEHQRRKQDLEQRYAPSQRVFLNPGDYVALRGDYLVTTILGSCVSACLYDGSAQVAGMNHFLLPTKGQGAGSDFLVSASGRYGQEAMELLLNDMYRLGARKGRLTAKTFGGASLSRSDPHFPPSVGQTNALFVQNFLRCEGIPVVASDLGGHSGRVILFETGPFVVWRRRLRRSTDHEEIARVEQRELERKNALVGTEGHVRWLSPDDQDAGI